MEQNMKWKNLNQMIMHKVILVSGLSLCYLAGCAQQTATLTDSRDGKTYKTVTIGTQTWMAENLNYEMPDSWCYDDSLSNCAKYGRLYTWEAAKKASPAGWHLPSDEEWKTLECHLGMTADEVNIMLYRGEDIGTKLKSESDWELDNGKNHGNNESGFSALPGGHRGYDDNHSFVDMGERGAWWSRSPDGRYSWRRAVYYNKSGIDRDLATRTLGFSVRCIKD